MADIDLKTETPDTTLPTTGFLFGADSQAAASPSVYSTQAVATTLLGSTTLTGATITTSQPVFDLSQTWNNAAVTFTGLKFNATDTASAAGSLLMQLLVANANRFSVDKSGNLFASGYFNTSASQAWISEAAAANARLNTSGLKFYNGLPVGWSGTSNSNDALDTILTRRAAANLRLGAADAAAPVAQTLSVQSVVAGTSNTAGANLTITGSQGTGTGAGGSIIFQVAPAGSSGTAQNALATALTIASDRSVTFTGTTISFSTLTVPTTLSSAQNLLLSSGSSSYIGINSVVGVRGVDTQAVVINQNYPLVWGSDISYYPGTSRTQLWAEAPNTLALRNGGTSGTPVPQTFNIYNFHTDASNYERASIRWASNVLTIGPQVLGTGVARSVSFTDGGGTERINIAATSGVVLVADMQLITASSISYIGAASSGFTLRYSSNSDSSMMVRFTGTTSSFPALKRVSANIQVVAADDAGSAGFIVGNQALATTATDGFLYVPTCAGTPTGTPTTQTGTAPIVVDTTNNKLYFYSAGTWRDAGP